MKKTLFILIIACIYLYGCKKSSKPGALGSTYTKNIAGTRQYNYLFISRVTNPPYDTVTNDTTNLTIEYINNATLAISSVQLSYTPDTTQDSILLYEYSTSDASSGTSYILTYNINSNKIQYYIYSFAGASHYGSTIFYFSL